MPFRLVIAELLRPLVLVAILATVALGPAAEAAQPDDAERQLAFAREELEAGDYQRAVVTAESALRLDGTLYDCLLIKALAYEALGQLDLAESLLVAYSELSRGSTPSAGAEEALARIRAERATLTAARRSRPTDLASKGSTEGVFSEPLVASPYLDTETHRLFLDGFRTRVRSSLKLGHCGAARAAAVELTLSSPDEAEGYRLLGDSERCDDRKRAAVLAYRDYQAIGGDDPRVELLIQSLSTNLGTLDVEIARPADVPFALLRLELGQEDLEPSLQEDGRFRFADLPPATSALLRVAGKGLEPLAEKVAGLGPGEERLVRLEPTVIGLATIRLTEFPTDLCDVTVLSPDGVATTTSGGTVSVTAMNVTARVSNDFGEIEVPLPVSGGDELLFDPQPWIPAELTVVGVPAGSELRVFVEGAGDAFVEHEADVPPLGGEVDTATGVRVAPALKLRSLIGGTGGLFVVHPALGRGNASLALEPGNINATTFNWEGLDGVPGVQAAWTEWQHSQARSRRKTKAPITISVTVGVAGAAAAIGLWAAAAETSREVAKLRTDAAVALGQGDLLSVSELSLQRERLLQTESGLVAGAVASSVLGGVGLVVSIPLGVRGSGAPPALDSWDPTAITPPEPEEQP